MMSKYSLAFVDSEVERAYRTHHARSSVVDVRQALIGGLIAWVTVVSFAYVIAFESLWTVVLRVLPIVLLEIIGIVASYRPAWQDYIQVAAVVTNIVAALTFVSLAPFFGVMVTCSVSVIMLYYVFKMRQRMLTALPTALVVVVPIFYLLVQEPDLPVEQRYGAMATLGVMTYLVMTGVWTAERQSRRLFAQKRTIVEQRLALHQAEADVIEAKRAGSYALTRVLGRGGMGEVWLAKHRMLARPAAVKLILPQDLSEDGQRAMSERFDREAQATAALRSVHTVELYDYGETADGGLYYAMELLDGIDIQRLVQTHGALDADRVIYLLRQICDSLAEAHRAGLVHRDIKPANLYLCQLGGAYDFVKVLDFGLVKSLGAEAGLDLEGTGMGKIVGTPAYMAPEQVRGLDVDARTDIYAVGCVAFWMLTGRQVFRADTAMDMVVAHLTHVPAAPSSVADRPISAALEAIVLQCMEKDPADRPQSIDALAQMLEQLQSTWSRVAARHWWDSHEIERLDLDQSAAGETRFVEKRVDGLATTFAFSELQLEVAGVGEAVP